MFAAAGLLAVPAATAQEAPNLAVTTPPAAELTVDRAIEEGVRFLVSHQNEDGSFGHHTVGRSWEVMADVPGSHYAFKTATTALCWMGLRDQKLRTPESEEAARRALAYLVKNVRVKRPNGVEMYNVWSFGYGLRALAQALGTGAPGADEAEIRATAESLIEALGIYQVPDGGWGYYDFNAQTYRPSGTSMSFTTATILIALHEARKAGLEVPQDMIDKAVKSVQVCRKADGSYIYGWYLRYRPLMGVNQPKGSSMRTPGCNLALRLFDADVTDDDLRTGLEHLVGHNRFAIAGVRRPIPHESWYQVSGYFFLYGHQYAALGLELLPPQDQQRYWPPIVRAILKSRQPDGSFWDYPLYGYHKFYGTGYALIALSRCPEEIASTIWGHSTSPTPGDDPDDAQGASP
ncbi:MAG: prenyltransferase/squalene oxidase repeat-containing protein [Planctomycetota bacterium]